MIKYIRSPLSIFLSIILMFMFMPIQAFAVLDDGLPKVISHSISDKIIAYKGIENPGFTTIKFNTSEPVVATLQISAQSGSTKVKLSEWLKKKSEYEVHFVPMSYEKAYYDEFVSLPPGKYGVSVNITDESYNTAIIGLGTIEIVKENKEQPLVEILDIKITNEVKASQIEPKIKFQYKVNRPAYLDIPVFRDYANSYLEGERTQIDSLPMDSHFVSPGVYEVEWNLRPPRRFFRNNRGIMTLQPNDRTIVPPDEYKLFFRLQEDSIKRYAFQDSFGKLIDETTIDLLISSRNNNTEIKITNGWTPVFQDIQNHWAKSDILFLSSKNIIKGTGNNTFSPNNNVTRAEYAALILRVLNVNINPQNQSRFTDVPQGAWYHDAVETSAELGLIKGFANNTFAPNQSITRQEMAAIAVRALQYKTAQQPTINEDGLNIYSDRDKISSWAKTSVIAATQYNLIKGKSNNLFDPNGISTRAEGATIIKRLYDNINSSSN